MHIIDVLGERSLLLPEWVNRGLAANDRVKYYLTLLQAARQHAADPGQPAPDLTVERLASGVEDEDLDAVVGGSRPSPDGGYLIPGAAALHARVAEGLETMLAAVEAGAGADAVALRERLEMLLGGPSPDSADRVPEDYVDALTHAQRKRGDSVHLLVMDLHKALNRLQAKLAHESIDGAYVYAIDAADRPLVRAFMAGLNATAPLKFDHPGLGTTATRDGVALVIQNDIGTTDAHVLVLRVEGMSAVLTYTDIHMRRATFFMSLFERGGTQWEDTRSRQAAGLEEGDNYYLCVGRYTAPDSEALAAYLRFIGSRIVFLIDWNRARKRLRQFVRMRDAVRVLKWAADNDFGHRGFLELGGERLIYEAIENAMTSPVRYGERLDRVLGRDTVVEYLKRVLRVASEGLREGRSARSIRDEIKAELLERFHTADQSFLDLLGEQAALGVELAGAVRDGLVRGRLAGSGEFLELTARRAKHWETRADELVMQVRGGMRHATGHAFFERLAGEADDIADHLEEAAFLLPLLPRVETPAQLYAPLVDLSTQVLDGTRHFVRCVESGRHVERGGVRDDLRDFLQAVDRIIAIEHETDAAERQLIVALIEAGAEHRQLYLLSAIGKRLEKAADCLARCALVLSDHIVGEVMRG